MHGAHCTEQFNRLLGRFHVPAPHFGVDSGESGPKDQVALQWLHYYYTLLSYWCTAARSIEIVRYCRTISRHAADGISKAIPVQWL